MITYVYRRRTMQKSLQLFLLAALTILVSGSDDNDDDRSPNGYGRAICRLPSDIGTCDNGCIYYFYDYKTRTCKTFDYGCCGGNANNFKTKELCQKVCQKRYKCPKVYCKRKACENEKCPGYPNAVCVPICPCQSIWLYQGEDVTNNCYYD